MGEHVEQQITIRVGGDLYDALVLDAREHGQTVAQSVLFRLGEPRGEDALEREHWRFVIDTVLVRSILDRLTYWPGWRFGLSGPDRLYLMAWVDDIDSHTGEPREASVRRIPIDWPRDTIGQPPALNTEAGVVAWVRHALHEWAAHEVNEGLRLDGELVHDSHACVQCLVGGCRA